MLISFFYTFLQGRGVKQGKLVHLLKRASKPALLSYEHGNKSDVKQSAKKASHSGVAVAREGGRSYQGRDVSRVERLLNGKRNLAIERVLYKAFLA